MDSDFASKFGAVELDGVISTLAQSERALASLLATLKPEEKRPALEMMKSGELVGDLGNTIWNFFSDEIVNEGTTVWSGVTFNAYEPDDTNQQWPLGIDEYEGVFFVWALEHDHAGYFLSADAAKDYIEFNWSGQVEGPEEDSPLPSTE